MLFFWIIIWLIGFVHWDPCSDTSFSESPPTTLTKKPPVLPLVTLYPGAVLWCSSWLLPPPDFGIEICILHRLLQGDTVEVLLSVGPTTPGTEVGIEKGLKHLLNPVESSRIITSRPAVAFQLLTHPVLSLHGLMCPALAAVLGSRLACRHCAAYPVSHVARLVVVCKPRGSVPCLPRAGWPHSEPSLSPAVGSTPTSACILKS